MKKNRYFKKIILTTLTLGLSATVLTNFFTFNDSNNKYSFSNSFKNDTSTSDITSSPTYFDSKPVANSNITSFSSYQPSYEDNNIAPVSQLNGSVGMTSDKKTLVFTSYDGFLVWSSNLTENILLKKYYKQVLNIDDISSYSVVNYLCLVEDELLVVIFGDVNKQNLSLFGVDLKSGYIYTQPDVSNIDLNNNKNFVKINDGICLLYQNSKKEIIATTGNKVADYSFSGNTIILSFVKDLGFRNVPSNSIIVKPENTNDLLLGFMPASSATNYAIFLSSTSTTGSLNVKNASGSDQSTTSYDFKYYAYIVDDNLKAITNNNNAVKIDLASSVYHSKTNDLDFNKIQKRFSSISLDESTAWFWCDSEFKQGSGISKLTYSNSSGSPSATENYYSVFDSSSSNQTGFDYSDLSVNSISFDSQNKKVLMSFSGQDSSKKYHILNEELNLSSGSNLKSDWTQKDNISYLVPLNLEGISTSYFISYNNTEAPLFSESNNNLSEITNNSISFKKVNDVVSTITNNKSIYKGKVPTQITEDDLKSCIVFSDATTSNASSNNYTKSVSDIVGDDNKGTLSFSYNISYNTNYGSDAVGFSFDFNVNLSGLFSYDNDFKFEFITHLSPDGNATIDSKYQNIVNLKNSTIPSQVTKKNILDNFLNYTIKNNQGNDLTISENDISLTADDAQGTLLVTVTIPSISMPIGFSSEKLTYSYTYTGFINLQGYTKQIIDSSDNITELKKAKYASQINFNDIINNFITLGTSYSKDATNWTFTLDTQGTNNFNGTLSFRLIYTSSSLPSGTSDDVKNVFGTPNTWYQITGFKTIFTNYENVNFPIDNYSGLANAQSLWTQFQVAIKNNNLSSSTLYNSLNINQWLNTLHLTNFNDIDIAVDNLDTADTDGYLNLRVGYKDNATTSLNIAGTNFVFDSNAKTNFANYFKDNYPFVVKWNLNQFIPEFNWVIPTTSSAVTSFTDDSISINLNISSYQGISNSMRASEVSPQNITSLFNISNYQIIDQPKIYADDESGTLKAVIILEPKLNNDAKSSGTITKNVFISGFKINAPQVVEIVPIIVGVIFGIVLITSVIFIVLWNKKRKKIMYMQNLKRKKR